MDQRQRRKGDDALVLITAVVVSLSMFAVVLFA